MMMRIRKLELHASHACNLTCESCSHYSNHGHSGMISPEEADRQMGLWSNRLDPRIFSIMGGEPTLNPRLTEIVEIAVKHWKSIEVVSNGFYLDKHPGLGEALGRAGRKKLALSRHSNEASYIARFEEAISMAEEWRKKHHIDLVIRKYEHGQRRRWTRRYEGYGPTMRPFHDQDQEQSWKICNAKWCMQLHGGLLWKCPILAYLPMQAAKFPEISSAWEKGLAYKALDPSCSNGQLKEFVRREAEDACSLCPATENEFEPASPLINARELIKSARTLARPEPNQA